MSSAGKGHATALGAGAVLLWSVLALLTVGASRVPPFQLLALSFAIATALGFFLSLHRNKPLLSAIRDHPGAALLTTGALAGYHFFYFVALRTAPAVDASLIAYLWPLLIVVFAGLAHGGLRAAHLAGAVLGLAGAWLLLSARGNLELDSAYAVGYGAAVACALIWSSYSVANRRFAHAPVEVVTVACAATALLGLALHAGLESWYVPSTREWLFVALLGLGPVGAAFFLWDYGTKHGNLALLGVTSYAAPVLSTVFLVLAGTAAPTWQLALSALLVAGGAALASRKA
ncbi:MAG TPA: DMT family transporter [Burkholderiales bacterium]|nr:DMT family transporter [Burkholderiales bacterium]